MFVAHVLRVLIAAPGDTVEECEAVEASIGGWNVARAEREQIMLLPWRWTKHAVPALGSTGQSVINSQAVDRADIVVAIFDSRLGQPTSEFLSGTVEEIERARAEGTPVHVYFSTENISRNADLEQVKALRDFRDALEKTGLVGEYANPQDVGYLVRNAIEHDIEKLALTGPRPPKGVAGAIIRTRYHHEKLADGVDTKGKPRFRTISRLVMTNQGTRTAEQVEISLSESDDVAYRIEGPSKPFDLLPGAERDWPFIPLQGDEVTIVSRWREGERELSESQTISI